MDNSERAVLLRDIATKIELNQSEYLFNHIDKLLTAYLGYEYPKDAIAGIVQYHEEMLSKCKCELMKLDISYNDIIRSTEINQTLYGRMHERDKNVCQRCGISEAEYQNANVAKRSLCIHHINYNQSDMSEFNLITLCGGCNIAVNKRRDYWQRTFSQKIGAMYKDCVQDKISDEFQDMGISVVSNGD